MFVRNIIVLFIAQMISVSCSVSAIQLGGILGSELASSPKLATLPVSVTIIGTALSSVAAAFIMQAIGRRRGFAMAALVGAISFVLAATAIAQSSFWMFCAASVGFGFNLAFVQQYRFAAAESVAPSRVSQAVSVVLLGSIGGAFLGPRLIELVSEATGNFAGVYLCLAALLVLSSLLIFLGYRDLARPQANEQRAHRSTVEILREPGFAVAVFGGMVAYGVMSLIMTATPLSMHVVDGHSMNHTGWVLTSHVLAMYVPSLFSGFLIARFGARPMMIVGLLLLVVALGFGWAGQDVHDYWLALVALGVGWNFLYVGATTQLVASYRSEERFKAQAINELSVFGSAALASLLAGVMLHSVGWHWLLYVPVPFLFVLFLSLMRRPAAVKLSA